MSKKTFIIDPGHGGIDPGANGFGIQEKVWNLRISLYQYERLKNLGVDIAITRTDDSSLSAVERTNMIRGNYDYCISNHWNAFNGTARGVETIHSIHANPAFATKIANALVEVSGLPMRRVFSRANSSGTDFYFMHRLTGSTQTVIIEYSFMDNKPDHDWYLNDENFYKAAEVVIEEICKEAGVKYKAPKDEKKPVVKQEVLKGQLLRVQTGAFSKRENADALQESLENAGIDTYLVEDQGLFKVQVGAYSKRKNAEAQAKRIEELGFDTFLTTQVGRPALATKEEKVEPKPAQPVVNTPSVSIGENSKVTINRNATVYVTGEAIPSHHKGVEYTVHQTANGRVLIREIMSWVHLKDVTAVGSAPRPSSNTNLEGARVRASRLFLTSASTSPARTTPIVATVDIVRTNWRNEVRLKNNSGAYVGFARRSDLTRV